MKTCLGAQKEQWKYQKGQTYLCSRKQYATTYQDPKKSFYKNQNHHPKLKEIHADRELSLAMEHMSWNSEWTSVLYF